MLTFYHMPLSINSRRVWVALLEKNLPFEERVMTLSGDQFTPEFLALNPFHHIPVLVDGDVTVIESFAILDYLEARFPTSALLPTAPAALATVRMVQLVTVNELVPAINPLIKQMMGFGHDPADVLAKAREKAEVSLRFYAGTLGDGPFFCGDQLTLADIVLGTYAPWFEGMGLPMDQYPTLTAWSRRLLERPSWQATQPTEQDLAAFRDRMQQRMAAQGR